MGANGSHQMGSMQGGGMYQSQAVVPYGAQQTSVQSYYGGGAAGAGAPQPAAQQAYAQQAYGSGGPLGVTNDPNMVWDEARGGYWVKETIVDESRRDDYDSGGGYQVYGLPGGRPGKIVTRTCCEPDPEPNIYITNQKKIKKVVHCDDDDITIVNPPPVVVMPPPCPPPPPPATNIIVLPMCCPEKPKPAPCGPTTFFPEVRERSYRMETQTRTGPCVSSPCAGMTVISCGPCGGHAPPACGRCQTYHR